MEIKKVIFWGCAAALVLPVYAAKIQPTRKTGHYVSHAVEQTAAFGRISVNGDIEVEFMQSPGFSVHVSGAQKWAEAVSVHVQGDDLKIGFNQTVLPRRGAKLRAAVTAPKLHGVDLAGKSELHVHGALQGELFTAALADESEFSADGVSVQTLEVRAAGRAQADINRVDAQTVAAQTFDRAEIELSGLALKARFENNGAGEIDAADLRVQTAEAVVKGKGEISVSAYETLAAAVQGKGKIKYRGTPVSLQQSGNTHRIVQDLED